MAICIWVDCDDVISDTRSSLLKRQEFVSKWIIMEDFTTYHLKDLKKLWIDAIQALQIFDCFLSSSQYFQTQPVPWAYEKLNERRNKWYKLFVVTARNEKYKDVTIKWVETYFPWIFSDYLFTTQYPNNEMLKSQLCNQKWIKLLIDDSIENIQDINSIWIPWILLDKPRNQWMEDTNLLKRVYSRDEMDLNVFFSML